MELSRLPRGGVPVAYEVARALDLPLDVFVVSKLGVPDLGELAMGAVTSDGTAAINLAIIEELRITQEAGSHRQKRAEGPPLPL
jgi:putative phosphoribosyl transferase